MVDRGTDIDMLQSHAIAHAYCQCDLMKAKKCKDASTQYERQNDDLCNLKEEKIEDKGEDIASNSFAILDG